MKILKIITENTLKPFHVNAVKRMNKSGIDDDYSEMWDFLSNKLFIEDMETKLEIMHLYHKYYGEEDLQNMSDSDLEDLEDLSDVEETKVALSLFLDIPHILLEEEDYSHYGLTIYKDITSDEQYAVGEDYDATKAMEQYFDGWVDNMGGIENIDRYLLDDFLELDSYSVSDYARDLAIDRVDQLDEDEVIEEAGYNMESFQERIENIDNRITSLEDEITDLEYEQEEDELEEQISDLKNNIESLEEEKSEIVSEMEGLYETAKEELVDKYADEIVDDIDDQGLDYFIDQGYTLESAVNYFFNFDESGLESYLVENEDRGSSLGSWDGVEHEQFYSGTYYYIYRVD